ncbi:MAG: hypothetical protein DSZ05_09350 [Sulfurospirillum sp.]|nr:MAG: hypothetical protein DSZ05_09350 [Sulfurospirillum sp.]
MKRRYITLSILLMTANLFVGCGGNTSFGGGDVSITSATGDRSDKLGTLSLNSQDIKKVLEAKPWKRMKADVASFYENSIYSTGMKSYPVDITFQGKRVVAYADCQRITANYKIEGKNITFSKLSVSPAIELASCVESEFADDAVIVFFENSFSVKTATEKSVLFEAEDFDTTITLER